MTIRRAPWVACAALLGAPAFCADTAPDHPLLALAEKHRQGTPKTPPADTHALRALEHEIGRAHPPADGECAASIGASRYSDLYRDIANERFDLGELTGAAEALQHALACRPRSAALHERLANVLFAARDFAGTRGVVDAGLLLDPRATDLNMIAGFLAFVDERWADAIVRFRYVAASVGDRPTAAYAQALLWLSQLRGGVTAPTFVDRTLDDEWPRAVLFYLSGRHSEADLVGQIESHEDNDAHSLTVRICEALFYVGEAALARGDSKLAREYFVAAARIKGTWLIEHTIALSEIAKLRGR